MSAKNWRKCPECHKRKIVSNTMLNAKVRETYGKVSAEEYEKLLTEVRRQTEYNPEVEMEETLREDYEIGIDIDGNFYVSYLASCETCGFEFRYKHEQATKP